MAEATTEGAMELTAVASEMAEVAVESVAEVRVVEAVGGEGHLVGRRGGV